MELRKVYVEVTAQFQRGGGLKPLSLRWADGRVFEIEHTKAMERAPAQVEALLPVCFTCVILGKTRKLYYEPKRLRWFVETFL